MGFSRQEYWSGLSFPFLGDLLDPGIEPGSPALQADALPSEPPGTNVKKFTVNLLGKKHQELQEHSSYKDDIKDKKIFFSSKQNIESHLLFSLSPTSTSCSMPN